MSKFVWFTFSLLNLVALYVMAIDYYPIKSDGKTNWGDWGKVSACSNGAAATGFRLLVETLSR